jgi:hypothetical protein
MNAVIDLTVEDPVFIDLTEDDDTVDHLQEFDFDLSFMDRIPDGDLLLLEEEK